MGISGEPRNTHIDQALLLISRLERLSADSYWAHRASGLRGALLRSLDAGLVRDAVVGYYFGRLAREVKLREYAEIARLKGLTRARVTQLVNLTLLRPDTQRELLFKTKDISQCETATIPPEQEKNHGRERAGHAFTEKRQQKSKERGRIQKPALRL